MKVAIRSLPAACLFLVSVLKIEAICSSEMSIDFTHVTQCYKPQYRTLGYCTV
jgi:hypothetical protein